MNINDLMAEDLSGQTIAVLGRPASGKTHIGKMLAVKYSIPLISTDYYMSFGFEQALYELIEDLRGISGNFCLEGMLAYRWLRKGLETAEFAPNTIIEVEITSRKQQEIYLKERDAKKLKYMQGFARSCMTVYNQYHQLLQKEQNKPTILTVENNW